MPDASFVGTALAPSAPYLVGREKIKEFARAVGEDAPVCTDLAAARAAGHPDLVAPPTFVVTFAVPLMEIFLRQPAVGWNYSRMVHGDQSIVLHRPIHGGDELVTTIHVEDLSSRAGSYLLTMRCAITDVEGEAVATTRSLFVTQGEP